MVDDITVHTNYTDLTVSVIEKEILNLLYYMCTTHTITFKTSIHCQVLIIHNIISTNIHIYMQKESKSTKTSENSLVQKMCLYICVSIHKITRALKCKPSAEKQRTLGTRHVYGMKLRLWTSRSIIT